MRNFRSAPEVNTGSMADIAFLLLIFFLVSTTIPNDKGIVRKLPKKCIPGVNCSLPVGQHNILNIALGKSGDLLVNEEITSISELREKLKRFIDNNADKSCDYCDGDGDPTFSENPTKAVVSLQSDRMVPYATYIAVQNELTGAYYELRENFMQSILQKDLAELNPSEVATIQKAYPLLISEAEIK